MPQALLISSLIFLSVILLAAGSLFSLRSRWDVEAKSVKRQLQMFAGKEEAKRGIDIIRKRRKLSDIPWLDGLLTGIPVIYRVDFLLEQADVHCPVGVFLLLSLVTGLTAFSATASLCGNYLFALAASGLLGAIPFIYLKMRKKKRFQRFERQLPDALGMLAKSLKAGHSFSAGMMMVAHEFEDPIGAEFDKALNEINLGLGLNDALKGMTERIDCADIRFFTVSVIIQRETGGNLAEILENISHLIRERFKLKGRIKTLSAEGRLSAVMMIAIPIFIAGVLFLTNRNYLDILVTDPVGQILVMVSIGMMTFGVIIMKRMVSAIV